MKKKKRTEEEEKEAKQESRPVSEIPRPIPDIKEQAGATERKILAFCFDLSKR